MQENEKRYLETFGNEKFCDETFLLKARLAIHVLSAIAKSYSKFALKILEIFGNSPLSTSEMIDKIKSTFHIEKDFMKDFQIQFLENTGVPHLTISFQDQRRDNKINF